MDNFALKKVSSSMRNAITTNNYEGHVLGKTVKQLEVERDLNMLSLQIKEDEAKLSSSPKLKAKRLTSLPHRSGDTIEEPTESNFNELDDSKAMKKRMLHTKERFLPLIRSQSAKSRRTPSPLQRNYSLTHSSESFSYSPSSPKSLRNLRTNSLISSSATNISWESGDKDRPSSGVKDSQNVSLRYNLNKIGRSSTASPILTAKFPKNSPPIDRKQPTGGSPPSKAPNSPTVAHRGLAIKPSSWNSNKQTTKSKQDKTKVFSRLYQTQPKVKKTVEELLEAHAKPKTSNLERRRRSLSLTDLTDIMGDLKNCRYLRTNSIKDI